MKLKQDGQYTPGREARWKEGIDLILEHLRSSSGDTPVKVLDIGCGDGYNYKFLLERMDKENIPENFIEYHAIDNNKELEKVFKNSAVKFYLGDIENIKKTYASGYFDVIIASEIIEHIVNTDKFILDIKDVLNDSGNVYLTTPNLGSWHSILSLMLGYQPLSTEISCLRSEFGKIPFAKKFYYDNVLMHVRAFTIRGLKDFLEFHGFRIEKTYGGGYTPMDKLIFGRLFVGLSPILKVIIRKNT